VGGLEIIKMKKNKIINSSLFFLLVFSFFAAFPTAAAEKPLTFVELAKIVKPSVVNVYTTIIKSESEMKKNFHDDEEFESQKDFFHKFFNQPPMREYNKKNLGSGVIIDKSGYILTNNHVVEEATKIRVSLANGSEYDAKLVGKDEKTDLALIEIKAEGDLPAAKIGNSDTLSVGEWVMAIGNPYGLEETVTVGIVSAKGRVMGAGPYDDFIQTSASINPGNSGGPLVNMNGEVIGVNTLILSRGQNLGFAIPINMAKNIFEQLKIKGKVVRGWLGVYVQKVTPDMVTFFGLDSPKGALVSEATPGGPAASAGILRGDVIISFNGIPINDVNELPRMVAGSPVGTNVKVGLIRKGKKMEIPIVLGELKEELLTEAYEKKLQTFGMSVDYLTSSQSQKLGIGDEAGLYVLEILQPGQAGEKGIKRGDQILEVNRIRMKSIEDYENILKDKNANVILFLLKRGDNTFFVTMERE